MLVLNYVFSRVYGDIPNMDRVRFWVRCDREHKMEVQVYDEAWLTSMFQVRCQENEPGLGLGLGIWKALEAGYF